MTSRAELDGVLVVDKACGPSSHDVVRLARKVLGTRAIGHTGTLDPLASGVLVLVIGEATKLVSSLGALEKRYEATLKLGVSTHSLDAAGEVDATAPVPALARAEVEAAAARFVGEIEQRAPRVSAIKVDGTSLYKRARRGEVFEAPVRRVRLDALEIRALRTDEIELALRCGSGFYVRSLARDLAAALGTVGHLSALRRTANGAQELRHALPFERLQRAREEPALRADVAARVLSLASVCRGLPRVSLDPEGARRARHGQTIPLARAVFAQPPVPAQSGEPSPARALIAWDDAEQPVALVECHADHLRVLRGFRASS